MKRIILAALVLPVFLVGCGAPADEPGDNTTDGTSTGYGDGALIPDTNYYVKKIDVGGTDCVIYKDGDVGNITCGWPVSATPTPEVLQ